MHYMRSCLPLHGIKLGVHAMHCNVQGRYKTCVVVGITHPHVRILACMSHAGLWVTWDAACKSFVSMNAMLTT